LNLADFGRKDDITPDSDNWLTTILITKITKPFKPHHDRNTDPGKLPVPSPCIKDFKI